jgi:hypothetical protein
MADDPHCATDSAVDSASDLDLARDLRLVFARAGDCCSPLVAAIAGAAAGDPDARSAQTQLQ